jgi:hypothetical protein
MTDHDDVLDSVFHGCALTAYLQIAAETGAWPPPSEPTRQRAYDLYEAALADKSLPVGSPQHAPAERELVPERGRASA